MLPSFRVGFPCRQLSLGVSSERTQEWPLLIFKRLHDLIKPTVLISQHTSSHYKIPQLELLRAKAIVFPPSLPTADAQHALQGTQLWERMLNTFCIYKFFHFRFFSFIFLIT